MKHIQSTISPNGRTTVPQKIREKFGFTAGTRLNWQVLDNGGLLVSSIDHAAANLLDSFDPERHGGEAMAFAPVGREIGSPEYEGLTAQDWAHVQSKLFELIRVCGELPEATTCPLTEIELDGSANVQAALEELGHKVGRGVSAAVWRHYSRSLMAEWMPGEETVESAKHTLLSYLKKFRT